MQLIYLLQSHSTCFGCHSTGHNTSTATSLQRGHIHTHTHTPHTHTQTTHTHHTHTNHTHTLHTLTHHTHTHTQHTPHIHTPHTHTPHTHTTHTLHTHTPTHQHSTPVSYFYHKLFISSMYRSLLVPEAAVTVFSTPDDGCCDTRNM